MGDALAGEKSIALTLIGLQYDQLQKLEAQKSEIISPPGDEAVGVRARLNLLEERLRGEAGQERF